MSNPRELNSLGQRLADDAEKIQTRASDDFTNQVRQRLQPRGSASHPSWYAPAGLIATAAAIALVFFVVSPLDDSTPTTDTDQILATDQPALESPTAIIQESDTYLAQQEADMQAEYERVTQDWKRMKQQIALL